MIDLRIMEQKVVLREEFVKRRAALDKEYKAKADAKVAASLLSLPEYARAKSVLFYLSMRQEVDTGAIVQKQLLLDEFVLVPFMQRDNLAIGRITSLDDVQPAHYGVLEPKEKTPVDVPLDVVITPGLAFAKNGARLGFGKANYDRFFAFRKVG